MWAICATRFVDLASIACREGLVGWGGLRELGKRGKETLRRQTGVRAQSAYMHQRPSAYMQTYCCSHQPLCSPKLPRTAATTGRLGFWLGRHHHVDAGHAGRWHCLKGGFRGCCPATPLVHPPRSRLRVGLRGSDVFVHAAHLGLQLGNLFLELGHALVGREECVRVTNNTSSAMRTRSIRAGPRKDRSLEAVVAEMATTAVLCA